MRRLASVPVHTMKMVISRLGTAIMEISFRRITDIVVVAFCSAFALVLFAILLQILTIWITKIKINSVLEGLTILMDLNTTITEITTSVTLFFMTVTFRKASSNSIHSRCGSQVEHNWNIFHRSPFVHKLYVQWTVRYLKQSSLITKRY